MIDNIDFNTIMDIIKMIMTAVGILFIIYQRAEVIIAKYRQRVVENENKELEDHIKKQSESFNFIGDTLLDIVHASKMSTEDKTKVTKKFLVLKEDITKNAEEKDSPKLFDNILDLEEVVEDVKGIASGIIKRE